MTMKQSLLDKLNTRQARIGIVGLGYVGLPLAVEFAEAGFDVIGLDVDAYKVESINRGESYIPDIPTGRMKPLVEAGKLRATTTYADLSSVDALSICVPTPLRKTKDPDMSYVIESIAGVAGIAHAGLLIVLESTTYPGTTEELIVPRLTEKGFTPGNDIFIAFSPERIDPGNPTFGVRNTPKVVGGVTADCTDVVAAYYGAAVDHVVKVSSPTTAEMVKLLENTFRAVNIGLVNEMALMCDKLGIDTWEVIDAAKSKPFGFMAFYPGPGLGGHCIPIDPLYLSWKLKTLNYNARFIELASEINTSMPVYVVNKVADALNDDGKAVRGSRVLVLGAAYKRDVDDVRESPALDVIQLLQQKGADVVYHDPYVPAIKLHNGVKMDSAAYSDDLIAGADCVVVVTDHTDYDWTAIAGGARLIVDTRHAVPRNGASARIVSI
ncbi:MAG: nucleotide sugar dehydrogenase [Anaerolineae bacterium]|nr:nucleotide sugar dehydrogenase [Anaerolineae bacterium]